MYRDSLGLSFLFLIYINILCNGRFRDMFVAFADETDLFYKSQIQNNI